VIAVRSSSEGGGSPVAARSAAIGALSTYTVGKAPNSPGVRRGKPRDRPVDAMRLHLISNTDINRNLTGHGA
jgi:hypothetical protein